MKYNTKFISRKLEERSYLAFDFPSKDGNLTTYLPFLENIDITENQEATLTEHNPIGRSGGIFSYGGATSRTFRLNFQVTLLHIMELLSKDGISIKFKKEIYSDRENFVRDINASRIHRAHYFDLTEAERRRSRQGVRPDGTLVDIRNIRTIGRSITGSNNVQVDFVGKAGADEAVNLMLYWLNLVRSSTKNNSISTSYGPPIIRLNHGTMYNNIPCVATNYDIEIINEAGYELESLTPKQVKINMQLSEQRTGNFKKYQPFKKIEGDNNTGWESVLNNNTMDPYNGLIQR